MEEHPIVELSIACFTGSGPHELDMVVPQLSGPEIRIVGHDVWMQHQYERSHKRGKPDAVHSVAEPSVLRVLQPFGLGVEASETRISAYLTDNLLLRPHQRQLLDIEEGFAYVTEQKNEFTDRNGTLWTFLRHIVSARSVESFETVLRWQLCAHATIASVVSYDDARDVVIPGLEEVLLIGGFASAQRTTACSWRIDSANSIESVYRTGVWIPKAKAHHSWNDVLIGSENFQEFVRIAMARVIDFDPSLSELLKKGMVVAMPDDRDYLESRFLTMFSAFESLLLLFKRTGNLEYVVPKSRWKQVEKSLRDVLSKERNLFENEERLEIAKKALPAINRVSLDFAFRQFVQRYQLPTDDLWPLVDHEAGISLLQIRNQLSHGEHFDDRLISGLAYASLSLQLLIQRVVLALLEWPIDKSACSERRVAIVSRHFSEARAAFPTKKQPAS